MLTIRSCALALAGAALVAGTQAPASASSTQDAPDRYAAEATASGLRIDAFGQQLAVGSAEATSTSPDEATATGTGALLVTQGVGRSSAAAKGIGTSDGSATPVCSPLVLPEQVPGLTLSAACSNAQPPSPPPVAPVTPPASRSPSSWPVTRSRSSTGARPWVARSSPSRWVSRPPR